MSLPVTRPTVGRALVVASTSGRAPLVESLARLGFECGECDDPYTATLELSRRRLAYRAVILSLAHLFREELSIISTIKRTFPHLEIWLAHVDGRHAALAESMRLGADGLIDEEGLHRVASAPAVPAIDPMPVPLPSMNSPVSYHPMPMSAAAAAIDSDEEELETETESHAARRNASAAANMDGPTSSEPVLTAEELRALLQDQPAMPPIGGADRDS